VVVDCAGWSEAQDASSASARVETQEAKMSFFIVVFQSFSPEVPLTDVLNIENLPAINDA